MLISILANILVAAVVILLLWYAIHTIRKQQKKGGCGSCGELDGDGQPTSACRGCAFSSSCHLAHPSDETNKKPSKPEQKDPPHTP